MEIPDSQQYHVPEQQIDLQHLQSFMCFQHTDTLQTNEDPKVQIVNAPGYFAQGTKRTTEFAIRTTGLGVHGYSECNNIRLHKAKGIQCYLSSLSLQEDRRVKLASWEYVPSNCNGDEAECTKRGDSSTALGFCNPFSSDEKSCYQHYSLHHHQHINILHCHTPLLHRMLKLLLPPLH